MNRSELRQFEIELSNWYDNAVCSEYTSLTRNQLVEPGLIVYGASTIGAGVISQLIQNDIRPDWIVDKNPSLWGNTISGIEIKPVDALSKADGRFVLLASTHINEMIFECKKYDAKWILYSSIRDVCPLITEIGYAGLETMHKDEIMSTAMLLADKKSVDIYKAFLKYHYVFDNDFSTFNDPVEYFPSDLVEKIDYSYFVDAGAYNGDTLNTWLKQYKPVVKEYAYYAFEPSPAAYKELSEYVSHCGVNQNINIFNVGLGAKRFERPVIDVTNGMSVITDNESVKASNVIKIDSIDNFLNGKKITVIKADTEGYELELLSGALTTIKKQRPSLLVSAYHHFHDIWEIPRWIANLNLDYEIYYRHSPKVFTDTVCFAIPR